VFSHEQSWIFVILEKAKRVLTQGGAEAVKSYCGILILAPPTSVGFLDSVYLALTGLVAGTPRHKLTRERESKHSQ
jgi:hypothetical protein